MLRSYLHASLRIFAIWLGALFCHRNLCLAGWVLLLHVVDLGDK